MGFFDFVKDAGKKLFGDDEAPEASAGAIEKEVADLGLDGDVKVEVSGDTVKIAGAAPTQEAREKLIGWRQWNERKISENKRRKVG